MSLNLFLQEFYKLLSILPYDRETTRPKVIYDPNRLHASTDEILIGLGNWFSNGHSATHQGICLNNKGSSKRFNSTNQFISITDLIVFAPDKLDVEWRNIVGKEEPSLIELLERFTLIVEDIAPDSVFGLICWLAIYSGVDREEIINSSWLEWITTVRNWEAKGMVHDPFSSWSTLLSALGHSYIPPAGLRENGLSQIDFSAAWRDALRFTIYFLKAKADPNKIPLTWEIPEFTRASAAIQAEQDEYEQSLIHAQTMQLLLPLTGASPGRKRLVDAYFGVELSPSGAKKVIIRNDRKNSFLKQGYAVMGLYRPDPKLQGSGDDITLSVNPNAGVNLEELWHELESLENEKWGGNRPQENPRFLVSYQNNEGYTQPWWDDQGHYTILGAPRSLPDGALGSRLNWQDVINATWRCYQPLKGLLVKDILNHEVQTSLFGCSREEKAIKTTNTGEITYKRWMAAGWSPETQISQSIIFCPTAKRTFAALINRTAQNAQVEFEELPLESTFDLIPLEGGFAVVQNQGVFIFDDWQNTPLRLESMRQEYEHIVKLLGKTLEISAELHDLTKSRKPSSHNKLTRSAELRAALTQAKHFHATRTEHDDVRRFRNALEQRWGVTRTIEEAHKRAAEIEETQRTLTALQTRDLMSWLSTYGLPFFICGAIVTFMGPWLESLEGIKSICQHDSGCDIQHSGYVAAIKVATYLGLSLSLIVFLTAIQKRRSRTKHSKKTDKLE